MVFELAHNIYSPLGLIQFQSRTLFLSIFKCRGAVAALTGPQMTGKKIFDEDPRDTDGFWVVILSFVEEWLRVTMVRTRVNEHFVRALRLSHAGKKIDGGLRGTSIFRAGNYQDGTLEFLKLLCVDFVKAEPVNNYARAHRFRVIQICIERFLSAHAKSDG